MGPKFVMQPGFLLNREEGTPPALSLEGVNTLSGMTAGFVGLYELKPGREVNNAPAFQSMTNPQLWIACDPEGVWRAQAEPNLGKLSSQLKLPDPTCRFPCSQTTTIWRAVDAATRDWCEQPELRCRRATSAEIDNERAERAPPPAALTLNGSELTGLAAGFVGVYQRGREMSQAKRQLVEREVNGSPAWRHISNPCLWIARGLDGAWWGQVESNLVGVGSGGVVRLRDTACLYPCGGDTAWEVLQNGAWQEDTALLCREADLKDPLLRSLLTPPDAPESLALGGSPRQCCGAVEVFLGVYELQQGQVNGCPAWRHANNEDLWLVRARNGCWMGQSASHLGMESGSLLLQDTASPDPSLSSLVWHEFEGGKWHESPGLRCSAPSTSFDEVGEDKHVHFGEDEHTEHSHNGAHEQAHADADEHSHAGDGCCEHGHAEAREHSHGDGAALELSAMRLADASAEGAGYDTLYKSDPS